MNVRHPPGVLHSFSIKNVSYDKMDLRLFYFHVTTSRSSRPEVFCKKDVLINFAKSTGKHKESTELRPAALLNKGLWRRCFPVNFAEFLRTPFLQNTSSGCFCASKDA